MFSTVEARWFGRGKTPAAVLAWFNACPGIAEHQPLRQDHYLPINEADSLSIKLRNGGLEIKQRRRSYGLVLLSQSASGLVEGWTKWRFPLAQTESPAEDASSHTTAWITVDKERQLLRYLISAGNDIQPVAPDTMITSGCEVESTALYANREQWWTIAFEAFGESAGNHARLMTVATILLAELAPGLLSAADSYGYPRLLAGLKGEQ